MAKFDFDTLKSLENPLYHIPIEWGVSCKENCNVRVTLLYCGDYPVGMSYHGFKIFYPLFDSIDGVCVSRAYLPSFNDYKILKNIYDLEYSRAIKDSDLLVVTYQTELNFIGLATALKLAGLELQVEKREGPLVLVGGPASVNPALSLVMADAVFVGEGEKLLAMLLEEAVEKVQRFTKGSVYKDKREIFLELLEKEPYCHHVLINPKHKSFAAQNLPVRKALVDYTEYVPTQFVVPSCQVVQDRLTVEINRACTRGCRFCLASFYYRPYRALEPERVIEVVKKGIANTGYEEVGLLSLSASDYPWIEELINLLEKELPEGTKYSFPSLRVDTLYRIAKMKPEKMKKGGLTVAVEAGSERLRRVVNKMINLDDLMPQLEYFFKAGWKHVKLYFMIGLPTETEDDIGELISYVNELVQRFGKKNVIVNISTFVPKPFTPFEKEKFYGIEYAIDTLRRLKRELRGISLRWSDPTLSALEALLSRVDFDLASALAEFFYSRGSYYAFEGKGIRRESFALEEFLVSYSADVEKIFNGSKSHWHDFINLGVSPAFLEKERQKAYSGEYTIDCRERCLGCGPICGWYSSIKK